VSHKARLLFEVILATIVTINGFTNGIRCGSATEATGDLFPDANRNAVAIVRIYVVSDGSGDDVAWVYETEARERVTEAGYFLKPADALALGLPEDPSNRPGFLGPYRAFDKTRFNFRLCADGTIRRR
jgi:hypothetical protein